MDLERVLARIGRVVSVELGELAVLEPALLDLVAAAHQLLHSTSIVFGPRMNAAPVPAGTIIPFGFACRSVKVYPLGHTFAASS